jgi:sugar lactone lactonase YvrE
MSAVTLDAERLIDVSTVLGEGPAWDAARGVLSWVDVMPGHVHVCSPAGEFLRTYELGRAVGAAMPDGDGGFLLADAHGFTALAGDGTSELLVPVLADTPNLQFNDGKCDPAGPMALDETPHSGTLYRLDAGPAATPVLGELTVSNGLGWSPDRRTMWFADSAKPQVTGFEYDLDTGELGAERTVIAVEDTPGVPDGLCVDDDGCVWLALWDGESVRRAPRHRRARRRQGGHELHVRRPGPVDAVHHDGQARPLRRCHRHDRTCCDPVAQPAEGDKRQWPRELKSSRR